MTSKRNHSILFLKTRIPGWETELIRKQARLAEAQAELRAKLAEREKTENEPKLPRKPNPLKKERVLESKSPTKLAAILGISRQRAFQLLHPERDRAANNFRTALETGKITKLSRCEKCGKETENLEAHHPDYEKPLEVIWLCVGCHKVSRPPLKCP